MDLAAGGQGGSHSAALGAEELAEERLIEWLAAGKLPWSCTSWKGHERGGDSEGRDQQLKGGYLKPTFSHRPRIKRGRPQALGVSAVSASRSTGRRVRHLSR